MKTHKTIIKLILLFVFATVGWGASYGVNPSTIMVGESTKVYANLDSDLPAGYNVRTAASSSATATALKLEGGPKNWYIDTTLKAAGTYTLYLKVYKNGSYDRDIASVSITVKEAPPKLSSGVYIQTATNGFNLSWKKASGVVKRYELYRSTSSSSIGSKIYSGSNTNYTDTNNLSDGVTYYYTAKACNESGCTTGSSDYHKYTSSMGVK